MAHALRPSLAAAVAALALAAPAAAHDGEHTPVAPPGGLTGMSHAGHGSSHEATTPSAGHSHGAPATAGPSTSTRVAVIAGFGALNLGIMGGALALRLRSARA